MDVQHINSIQVYVVDDDVAVLNSLCALLGAHGYTTIRCGSAKAFLECYDPMKNACLLLDLRMPGMDGMELQAQLNAAGEKIPVIILTAHGDISSAVTAMKAGAIDFIEKPAREDHLLEALQVATDIVVHRKLPKVPAEIISMRISKLTEREREVLDLLLLGKINKEIAEQLGVSQRTVEIHRARVRDKMGARGVADLIRMLH